MANILLDQRIVGFFFALQIVLTFNSASAGECKRVSAEVACTCDDVYGHCLRGTVEVDPWLQNTLSTQVEVQLDLPFHHVQLLDAHNSYNNRAYGELYGSNDTCIWPPPYDPWNCTSIANQEFSLTDLLNMGIRAIELDNWFCDAEMRIAHLGSDIDQECGVDHVLFADAVEEIGQWLDNHDDAFIRIYMNEKTDQGNDDTVNDPFERYLGDRVLTPADLRDTYGGEWPTLRTMRQAGKSVVIGHLATAGDENVYYTHQGKFIHKGFWVDFKRKYFTNYPQCGGKNATNVLRFYSDSTHHPYEKEYLDGPEDVGYISDYTEFVKCAVQYPGGDQVTPQLMETAVYTWAKDEPSRQITDTTSCILLDATDNRWYTPSDCNQDAYYACQSVADVNDWSLSESAGGYDVDTSACPTGYRFALPQNGFQHQKLLEELDGTSVWLNVAPLLSDYIPPTEVPEMTTEGRAALNAVCEMLLLVAAAVTSIFLN